MKSSYKISGITCGGCVQKVTQLLNTVPEVTQVSVVKDMQHVLVESNKLLSTKALKQAMAAYPQYQLREEGEQEQGFWKDKAVWNRASKNTLNCLIGCSIGDMGTIIYLQNFHPTMSMWLVMSLAIVAGLTTSVILETVLLHIKEELNWSIALDTALRMSFLSMVAMEVAENATDLTLTGGGMIPSSDVFYWVALSISLIAGFIIPLPYNYYKLKKFGKACH